MYISANIAVGFGKTQDSQAFDNACTDCMYSVAQVPHQYRFQSACPNLQHACQLNVPLLPLSFCPS